MVPIFWTRLVSTFRIWKLFLPATPRSGDRGKKPKFWTLFQEIWKPTVHFFEILFHTDRLHVNAVREKKSSSKSVYGLPSYPLKTEARKRQKTVKFHCWAILNTGKTCSIDRFSHQLCVSFQWISREPVDRFWWAFFFSDRIFMESISMESNFEKKHCGFPKFLKKCPKFRFFASISGSGCRRRKNISYSKTTHRTGPENGHHSWFPGGRFWSWLPNYNFSHVYLLTRLYKVWFKNPKLIKAPVLDII